MAWKTIFKKGGCSVANERQIRRALSKAGYALRKSRIRNINADNLGGYMVVDATSNYVVAGARYDLTLEDVAEWLKQTNG